jgi:hypothetical protein
VRPHLGSLIGANGGLVFVLVNAGELPGRSALPLRVIAVIAFIAVIGVTLRSGSATPGGPAPDRRAWRTYLICVVAMVAAIPLGSVVLTRTFGQPTLVLPWVVLVVGAHFLPFAAAFRAGIFRALSWTLIAIALVGGTAAVSVDPTVAPLTGVVAGFALLAFSAAGPLQWRRRPVGGG